MRIAVIDLGTNTFNLLVAEKNSPAGFAVVYRNEVGVKIGQGGILRKTITAEAFDRGLQAVEGQMEKARSYHPDKVLVVATSGVRSAENGRLFIGRIEKDFGVDVEVVTGDREATLIYRGVRQSVRLATQPSLIVDIGGGSNECILAGKKGILWKESFDIGMARILERFQPSSPITGKQASDILQYYEESLQPLTQQVETHQPGQLIGCAGTFESVRSILTEEGILPADEKDQPHLEIPYNEFAKLHQRLLQSTTQERQKIRGLELFRVDMIVLASLFVNFIMEKYGFDRLIQSNYSIKEGVADEYLNP
jgi:exopolyphosphatase/guanosine-5'-triphosphate,3'-diphosphate pyrophosphatase